MPHFFAQHAHSSNIVGELYGLRVIPPDGSPKYRLTAHVCEHLYDTMMAEAVARRYGAKKIGDRVWISIQQTSHLTKAVHTFDPIQVVVARFAPPRLGQRYIQLGMVDLQGFFDVYDAVPPPNDPSSHMLLFEPLPQYKHWCHRSTGAAAP